MLLVRIRNLFNILKRLAFYLVIGALAACQSNGTSQLSSSVEEGIVLPERLTFVTWNVQKLSNPQIADDLSNLIQEHKPDLVFLQEAKSNELRVGSMEGHLANAWSYPWPGAPTTGVLTLSNSSPLRITPLQTEWQEFFVATPKVSLVTEHLLSTGEKLLAVNVHLLNFEIWEPFMLQAQLHDLELVMSRHEGPIILAGDFNTWSEARLVLVDELANRLELEEVTAFSHERRTGDLDSALLNGIFGIHPDLPLDRVYSRGFVAVSSEVLPYDSSDHRPVLVNLVPNTGLDTLLAMSGFRSHNGRSRPSW